MIAILFPILFKLSLAGIIEQYGPKPIELSINNQGRTSSYTFKFYLKTDIIQSNTLDIIFPKAQYTLPQGACSALKMYYLPRTGSTNTEIQLTCSVAGHILTAVLPEIKASASSYDQFRVDGVTNPTEGGTGYFSLETRFASVNVMDYNHLFGHVGLVPSPQVMTGVSASFSKTKVNEISDLTIAFTTLGKIEFDGYLILKFTALTFLSNMTCTTTIDPGALCTLESSNQIRLHNIKVEKAPGAQSIVIKETQNPDVSGVPGAFTIENWEKGANTIIDEKANFNLPSINPGDLKSDSASMFFSNFKEFFELSSNYKLTNGDEILYDFYFTTTNGINDQGKVEVTFPEAPKAATTCKCSMGLEDFSESKFQH